MRLLCFIWEQRIHFVSRERKAGTTRAPPLGVALRITTYFAHAANIFALASSSSTGAVGTTVPTTSATSVAAAAPTHVVEAKGGQLSEYDLTPEELGLERISLDGLEVQGAQESLDLIRAALSGAPGDRAERARAVQPLTPELVDAHGLLVQAWDARVQHYEGVRDAWQAQDLDAFQAAVDSAYTSRTLEERYFREVNIALSPAAATLEAYP